MPKKSAFASMTVGELESALQQNMRELYRARLESSSGQLKTSHIIRSRRREIARVKTALHAKVAVAPVNEQVVAGKQQVSSAKRRAK